MRTVKTAVCFLSLAGLVAPAIAGVHIGNPKIAVGVRANNDWTLSTTHLEDATITLTTCDAATTVTLSATPSTNPPQWAVPAGTWCEGEIAFAELTIFTANDTQGRHLEVHAALGSVYSLFDDDIIVSSGTNDDAIFIELGHAVWLDLAKQYLSPNQTSIITSGDPGYTVVTKELQDTLWYVDGDGNHVLSNSERAAGAFARP